MSKISMLACLLGVALATHAAQAAPTVEIPEPRDGEEAAARLDALSASGPWSELAWRARAWAAKFPDHHGTRFHYGVVLYDTKQFERAADEFRSAVSAAPDFVDGHLMLGRTLEMLHDDPGARREFERALALQPRDPDAMLGLDLVKTRQRLRARAVPEPEKGGTPEATAHDLVERALDGELATALKLHVDPTALARLVDRDTLSEDELAELCAYVERSIETFHRAQQGELIGWEIATAEPKGPEQASVTARLLYRNPPVQAHEVERQLRLLDMPIAEEMWPPASYRLLMSLPPDERRATLTRLVGRVHDGLMEFRFDLERRDGAWKITDADAIVDRTNPFDVKAIAMYGDQIPEPISPGGGFELAPASRGDDSWEEVPPPVGSSRSEP